MHFKLFLPCSWIVRKCNNHRTNEIQSMGRNKFCWNNLEPINGEQFTFNVFPISGYISQPRETWHKFRMKVQFKKASFQSFNNIYFRRELSFRKVNGMTYKCQRIIAIVKHTWKIKNKTMLIMIFIPFYLHVWRLTRKYYKSFKLYFCDNATFSIIHFKV